MNCEIYAFDKWQEIDIDTALRMHKDRMMRCIVCHGRVYPHSEGTNSQKAHFEHKDAHGGCSLGNSFNGHRSRHPRALT